jgi:ketol-acid reductoisomerase
VVAEVPAAVKQADLVMILTPDEFQSQLYRDVIEPNIKEAFSAFFQEAESARKPTVTSTPESLRLSA